MKKLVSEKVLKKSLQLKNSHYNSGVMKNEHLNDTLYEEKIKMRKVYLAALHFLLHQYNSCVIDEITKK
ncbi:TPA: hypothetical protein QCQ24_002321 [Bacillus cereus]|nr:hypothetical protein [Bacillus cereus]